MSFQFLCPQGHLLEGEPSQMGQQCDCPMCGTRFIIPTVDQPAPVESQANPFDVTGGGGGARSSWIGPPEESAEDSGGGFPNVAGGPEATGSPFDPTGAGDGPRMVHIPCPQGHELETPYDMIGQDVMCPFCGEQFNLRYKDSVEYKKEKAEERERRERKVGKMWYNWAIAAAIFVVGGLIFMIAMLFAQR